MVDIDIKNEIKAVIYESGHSLNEVAKKIGVSDTSLSNMLSRRSIRYSLAKEIAEAIGYELTFSKKDC
jgi:lambda repressor-like predicted transcriptional regulator